MSKSDTTDITPEQIRAGALIIKRKFTAWRTPPVLLPADHVITDCVVEIAIMLKAGKP